MERLDRPAGLSCRSPAESATAPVQDTSAHPVYGLVVFPATPRGSRSRPSGARWSATLLLFILSLALTGCISVTPPPGTSRPSGMLTDAPTALPSDAPTDQPGDTPAPGRTPRPTARPTPKPTPPRTPRATVSAAPGQPTTEPTTAAFSPEPIATPVPSAQPPASMVPSVAPASGGPTGSALPSVTPRPRPTAPQLTPGPARDRALAKTEVFGFLPSWELARADTIDLSQVTTLAWFGVEANARGSLVKQTNGQDTTGWAGWTSDTWKALQARAKQAGVRTVLTVQRFSWSSSQVRKTVRLLSDPVARMRLSAQVMDAIAESGADGVNLDFEPLPAEVSDDFTQLVRELRAAMNAVDPGLQLTFDAAPGVSNYDIASLTADDAADALFVMGYEYLTGSAAQTGSNAPLVTLDGADLSGDVANILALVPPDRVILGLPWYGRAWSTISRDPHSDTRSGDRWPSSSTINYRDAIVQAARTGRFYDTQEASAWSVYPSKVEGCATCRVTWRQLWYDDVDATRAKVQYALDQSLRGVGFWALGYQGAGDEMWSVLRLTVGGERDRKAPTGTAELDPGYVDGQRQGLPVVGPRVRLTLTAADGQGSGPAFVRVAVTGGTDADGQLTDGTTFPTTDAITFNTLTAGPVFDLPLPRNQRPRATPTPTPQPTAAPSAVVSPAASGSPEASLPASTEPSLAPAVVASGSPAPGASPSAAPGGSPSAAPSAAPSVTPEPTSTPVPAGDPGKRVIRVQWRDVAGNWSEPITIAVWYRPGAQPNPAQTPTPPPIPSEAPPFVPGESPSVDASGAPDASPSASPS